MSILANVDIVKIAVTLPEFVVIPEDTVNGFDRAHYEAIREYEEYGGDWNDFIEQAYSELQELYALALPHPAFVPKEWFVAHFYEWCYGNNMPRPLDKNINQVVECRDEGEYPMKTIEEIEALPDTKFVVTVSQPAQTRFNIGLDISTKGVRTWEITILNAVSVIEAVKLAAAVDTEMVNLYGVPKEPEKPIK